VQNNVKSITIIRYLTIANMQVNAWMSAWASARAMFGHP